MARPGRLLTPDDVTVILGVTKPTLYEWSKKKRGLQPTWRIGPQGLLRYSEEDVYRYLDSCRTDGRRLVA